MQLKRNLMTYSLIMLLLVVSAFFVYQSALPQVYNLREGDISQDTIVAPSAVVDQEKTRQKAQERAAQVGMVLSRSDSLSSENVMRIKRVMDTIEIYRNQAYQQLNETEDSWTEIIKQKAQDLNKELVQKEDVSIDVNALQTCIRIEKSLFMGLKSKVEDFANIIMQGKVDVPEINAQAEKLVTTLINQSELYKNEYRIISTILKNVIKPNAVYDVDATKLARENAFNSVLQNPILIPKGTPIVNAGDVITKSIYDQLKTLNLISTGTINTPILLHIILLFIVCTSLIVIYLRRFSQDLIFSVKNQLATMMIVFIPIIISCWITRIHPLVTPIYFTTILIALYDRLRTALIISILANFMILPITSQPAAFLFISVFGIVIVAMLTVAYARSGKYATLILTSAFVCGMPSILFDLSTKVWSYSEMASHLIVVMIAGGLCAILAIGLSPLLELLLSTVSPMRLVELSQPYHPLLRKLFLEASGTYQHCMMVANLGEKAGDAIGANALLIRVGAYYHDIGKISNAYMFTENQSDHNPHDHLPPDKSVRIIIDHVKNGLQIAQKYKLPLPIQRIIMEHHGNLLQSYFYNKACLLAAENEEPAPNEDDYRYPWSIPTSKESAIVMLSDSCEAAMKSMCIQTIEDAEKLIRNIVKSKIDHDQLIASGLSFQDVERIIQSFLQVYQGQFHKRVRYPSHEHQSTAKA